MSTLRIIDIVDGTAVDGPGLRTSIYTAGCAHECPGCHNAHTWPFDAGREAGTEELMERIRYNDFDVTFSGGDPMYQVEALLPLAREIKACGYSIWCYTGFTFEQLLAMPAQRRLLECVDVLVDGPFVQDRKRDNLRFRGSDNQRIIDVAASLQASEAVLLPGYE